MRGIGGPMAGFVLLAACAAPLSGSNHHSRSHLDHRPDHYHYSPPGPGPRGRGHGPGPADLEGMGQPNAFGPDAEGEMYVANYGGEVLAIVPVR